MGWKDDLKELIGEEKFSKFVAEFPTKEKMCEAISDEESSILTDMTDDVEVMEKIATLFGLEFEEENDEENPPEENDEEPVIKEPEQPSMGLDIRNLTSQKLVIEYQDDSGNGKTLNLVPRGMAKGVPVSIIKSLSFTNMSNSGMVAKVGSSPLREW